jgi:EAL domain-containing protein (putative c-di-GMP-specific phosphodiesterase class I)
MQLVPPPSADDPVERLLTLAADELGAVVTLQVYPSGPRRLLEDDADASTIPVTGPAGVCYGRLVVEPGEQQPFPLLTPAVESVARLIGERIEQQQQRRTAWDDRVAQVREVLHQRSLRMRYQPIIDLATGRAVGVEALARFPGAAPRSPDRWFADASAIGLGAELELTAIEQAFDDFAGMADHLYLSVNISPETATSASLRRVLRDRDLERVVIEITEHAEVADYPALAGALRPLRRAGLRLAVDDAGAGFASLRHILELHPEIIKLDRSLTQGIDRDPVLRALTYSVAAFASATDAVVVAEGIEADSELDALRFLGVEFGQGFHLCRPDEADVIARRSAGVIDIDALNHSTAG